jgi:hypothetical protein
MLLIETATVSEGKIMRTFALFGANAIAAPLLIPGGAFAWTADQSAPAATSGVDLSDPDNFKALQDKVNGNTGQSGFHFDANVTPGGNQYLGSNPYSVAPLNGNNSGFSYSPMPGFRGQPQ